MKLSQLFSKVVIPSPFSPKEGLTLLSVYCALSVREASLGLTGPYFTITSSVLLEEEIHSPTGSRKILFQFRTQHHIVLS